MGCESTGEMKGVAKAVSKAIGFRGLRVQNSTLRRVLFRHERPQALAEG